MEYDTSQSDALAANESEISRLRYDLDRAMLLLANAGIGFTRTPNLTALWQTPENNYLAVEAARRQNAATAQAMDELCGPTAYNRQALRRQQMEFDVTKIEKQPRMIDEASMFMLDWMETGEEPYDDAIARQILGDGDSYQKFRDRCAEAALQRQPVIPDDDKDVGC